MKKDFTVQTALTDFTVVKTGEHVGDLEISGVATCDHPRAYDSYEYTVTDIALIKNGVRTPFLWCINALFGDPASSVDIRTTVEAHMLFLFNEADDMTTDYAQDPNIFGQETHSTAA